MRRPPPASGLRRNRNWRALWFGQAVSVVGDQVFDITIVLWISSVLAKGQSWAPAAVGAVLVTSWNQRNGGPRPLPTCKKWSATESACCDPCLRGRSAG